VEIPPQELLNYSTSSHIAATSLSRTKTHFKLSNQMPHQTTNQNYLHPTLQFGSVEFLAFPDPIPRIAQRRREREVYRKRGPAVVLVREGRLVAGEKGWRPRRRKAVAGEWSGGSDGNENGCNGGVILWIFRVRG